jgi:hypothetical protein
LCNAVNTDVMLSKMLSVVSTNVEERCGVVVLPVDDGELFVSAIKWSVPFGVGWSASADGGPSF